jgi:long-subunit acyl-CoA synthetase (AMP-forming)
MKKDKDINWLNDKIQDIKKRKRNLAMLIDPDIKKKIRKALGLSNADQVFSGAAPISTDLIKWFWKLDIKI